MCGEKSVEANTVQIAQGSPPRVRGKAVCPLGSPKSFGITPACAGKRREKRKVQKNERDHPRVCGEKYILYFCARYAIGSPPRVRGKGRISAADRGVLGITPACAGKSSEGRTGSSPTGDHPRVCGEKLSGFRAPPLLIGSPPRVRGKVSPSPSSTAATRITPACAGKRQSFCK